MLTSAVVPEDLRSLLGPATFSQIPNNAQMVLQQAWTSHTDTLKTNLEKVYEREARAKLVLSNAKERVTRVETENKDLKASNKDLTEDLTRMEAAKNEGLVGIDKLTSEVARLRKVEDRFGEELSAKTRLANLYKSHSEEHNAKLEDLGKHFRQEKDIMAGRLEVSQAETARLQSQLDHQQMLVTDGETNLATVTDSKRKLSEEKDKIEKENEEKLEKLEEKLTTIVSEKIAAQADADKELARLKTNVVKLEAEKEELKLKVKGHSMEVDNFKKKLETANKSLEAKNKKNMRLEEYSDQLQKNGKSYFSVFKQEKKKSKELTAENKKLKENAIKDEEIEESLAAKDTEIKKLRENSVHLKKIGVSFRSKLQKKEMKNKELIAEIEKLQEEITKVYNNNDAKDDTLAEMISGSDDVNDEEEEYSEDEDSSGQQKKQKLDFFGDSD